MKKFTKIVSTAMAGLMIISAVPAVSASAATTKVSKPKVTVTNEKKGIKISWKKTKGAKKYVVMRKLSTAKKYTTVKTVNSSKAGSFLDKKAKAGKTYNYTVKAVNGNKSATSSKATIVRLLAPTSIKTAIDRDEDKYITWNKVSGAKKYQVFRAPVVNGKIGKYKRVQNYKSRKYYEWDVNNGIYAYKIKAVSGKSESVFSKVFKMDVFDPPYMHATLNKDYTGIELTWSVWYTPDTFDGFRIYRSTEKDVTGDLLVDLKPEDCLDEENTYVDEEEPDWCRYAFMYFDDKNLEEGVTYYYSIEVYDGKRVSEKTSESVTYKTAEYILKVGEKRFMLTDIDGEEISLEEFKDSLEMLEEEGYTISITSDDESIFTIDEEYNIVGVSEGKAYIVISMTITEGGSSMSMTEKALVKVLPADPVDNTPTDTPADTPVDTPAE